MVILIMAECLSLMMPTDAVYAADITPPTVANITSTHADGAFKKDEVIDIDITFSETVTSTGYVYIDLNTGGICYFTITNNTDGECLYTVRYNDNTQDLTVSSVSGVVRDVDGNPMASPVTTFLPGTNLGDNKNIVLDTMSPKVIFTSPNALTYESISMISSAEYLPSGQVKVASVSLNGSAEDSGSGLTSITLDLSTPDEPPVTMTPPNFSRTFSLPDLKTYYYGTISFTDNAGNIRSFYFSFSHSFGQGNCNTASVRQAGVKLTTIKVPIWRFAIKRRKVWRTKYVKRNNRWVKIRVWRYATTRTKKKIRAKMYLRVHAFCGPSIKRAFTKIYRSVDHPPINPAETGCYRGGRKSSNHYYGLACDINVTQNAAFSGSKPYAGSFWRPGKKYKGYPGWGKGYDPLSIPPDGSIANAFDSEYWGGQLTGDYMHHSINGW